MTFQVDLSTPIERMRSLDPVAEAIGGATAGLLPAGRVKDLLSGTILGHPLHPLLTDVVIGSWTSAAILDVLGGTEARAASRRLVGVGILAAVPTALAGLSDWGDTVGPERRVGLVHAAGNVTALSLFALSWRARRHERHARGFLYGMLGMGVATASGHLGGDLAYRYGVGVRENVFEQEPREWMSVLSEGELPEETPTHAGAAGAGILLLRSQDRVFALADRCSHRGCALHEGTVREGTVECPCHGSIFRLDDGSIVRGPARAPQPTFEARIFEGMVQVRARE